jgi:short-subunit dehydrogenase
MRIEGKVVLITGASEGIGAACAAEFRRREARLALTARSEEKLRKAGGADALIVSGDITDDQVRQRVMEAALARYGAIDILINNAGRGLYAPSWRAPMDDARMLLELNFFAPLAMIQLVAPHMRERRRGMIVNIGSIAGKVTLPWFTLYCASKYALGSLTDGLRMELRDDGIHAMTVCPGYVRTNFQEHSLSGRPPDRVAKGKMFAITPEQCAEAIADGVEREARTVVTPRAGWVLVALERIMPWVIDKQLAALNRKV